MDELCGVEILEDLAELEGDEANMGGPEDTLTVLGQEYPIIECRSVSTNSKTR